MCSLVSSFLNKLPGVRKYTNGKENNTSYQLDRKSDTSVSRSEDSGNNDSDDSRSGKSDDTSDSDTECSSDGISESVCRAMRSTGVVFSECVRQQQVYAGVVRRRRGKGRGKGRKGRGRRGRRVQVSEAPEPGQEARREREEQLARCPCVDLGQVEAAGGAAGAGEGHSSAHEEAAWRQARSEARCGRFQVVKPKPKETHMPDDTDLTVRKKHFFEVEWFRKQCDLFIVPPSQTKDAPTNEVIARLMQTARRHPVKESKLYTIDMEPKGRPLGKFTWRGSPPALKCMCPYKPCICHRTIPLLPKKKIPKGRGDSWLARQLLNRRKKKRIHAAEEAAALAAAEAAAEAAVEGAATPSRPPATAPATTQRDPEEDAAPLLAALGRRIEVERRAQDRLLPYLQALDPEFCLDACIPFFKYDQKCECGIEELLKQVREEEEAIIEKEIEEKKKQHQPVSRTRVRREQQPRGDEERRGATGIVACSYLVRWCSVGTQTEEGPGRGRALYAATATLHPQTLGGPRLHMAPHREESLTTLGRWRCEWSRRWREGRDSFLRRLFTVRETRHSRFVQVNDSEIDETMPQKNSKVPTESKPDSPSPPPQPPPPPPSCATDNNTQEPPPPSDTLLPEVFPTNQNDSFPNDTPPATEEVKDSPISTADHPKNSLSPQVITPQNRYPVSQNTPSLKDLSKEQEDPQKLKSSLDTSTPQIPSPRDPPLPKSPPPTAILPKPQEIPPSEHPAVSASPSNTPIISSLRPPCCRFRCSSHTADPDTSPSPLMPTSIHSSTRSRCCRSHSLKTSALRPKPSHLTSPPAARINSARCTPCCRSRSLPHLASDRNASPTLLPPGEHVLTPRYRCCRYPSHATPDSQETSPPTVIRPSSPAVLLPLPPSEPSLSSPDALPPLPPAALPLPPLAELPPSPPAENVLTSRYRCCRYPSHATPDSQETSPPKVIPPSSPAVLLPLPPSEPSLSSPNALPPLPPAAFPPSLPAGLPLSSPAAIHPLQVATLPPSPPAVLPLSPLAELSPSPPAEHVLTSRYRCCRYPTHATPDSQETSPPTVISPSSPAVLLPLPPSEPSLSSPAGLPPLPSAALLPTPPVALPLSPSAALPQLPSVALPISPPAAPPLSPSVALIIKPPRSRSCCHSCSSSRAISSPKVSPSLPAPPTVPISSPCKLCCSTHSFLLAASNPKISPPSTASAEPVISTPRSSCRYPSSSRAASDSKASPHPSPPTPIIPSSRPPCCRSRSFLTKLQSFADVPRPCKCKKLLCKSYSKGKERTSKNINFKHKSMTITKPSKSAAMQQCECGSKSQRSKCSHVPPRSPLPASPAAPAPPCCLCTASGRPCTPTVTFDNNDYLIGALDLSIRGGIKSVTGPDCDANTKKTFNAKLYKKIDEILIPPGVSLKDDAVYYRNRGVYSSPVPGPSPCPAPCPADSTSPASPNNDKLLSDSTSDRVISSELIIQNIFYEQVGTSEFSNKKQYNLRVEVLNKPTINQLKKISDKVKPEANKPLHSKKSSATSAWLHQRRGRPGRHTLAFVSQRRPR